MVTDDQVEAMRKLVGSACTNQLAIFGHDTLTQLYEIVSELQRRRGEDQPPRLVAERDRDRIVVAQIAATMAGDRGCKPLGVNAAGEYVGAARELLRAVDASYAESEKR